MLSEIIAIGRRIYNFDNIRERHRFVVFVIRALGHNSSIKALLNFFKSDELRQKILAENQFPIEQVTRAFFYNKSTFVERQRLIEGHFEFLQRTLVPEWAYKLGVGQAYEIWRHDDSAVDWYAILCQEPGQRKEGLLSLEMNFGNDHIYQIMFWLNKNSVGEDSLWIGAIQGPNMENAKDIVKDFTKWAHRYRTKNLILYMLMAVARSLKVQHIYAVSNEGYYANNHVRRDRKLKTDFGVFWEECGGHITSDKRFYELPLTETRKTMEEVPTRKRAVYRKRFAFQDDVDKQIVDNMSKILK